MTWRILNAEPDGYSEEARRILLSIGEVVEERVQQHELAERVREFDVLIVRLGLRVTDEVFAAGDHLRVVVSATTGLDHIDLDASARRGVTVLSLRGATELLRTITSTAEHTWGILLALVRRIPWSFDGVRGGGWDRDQYRGGELAGRRLGLLGLGRVAEQVVSYGRAFRMEVGAYDPYRDGWVQGVRRFEDVSDLLAWSDVLSIHLPLTDQTRGFLNRQRLELLQHGAIVVNTSRGAIVDEAAAADLLEQGHLGGIATDVLEREHVAEERHRSPLVLRARRAEDVLITPHLGGATVEAMQRTELFMANELVAFLCTPTRTADR